MEEEQYSVYILFEHQAHEDFNGVLVHKFKIVHVCTQLHLPTDWVRERRERVITSFDPSEFLYKPIWVVITLEDKNRKGELREQGSPSILGVFTTEEETKDFVDQQEKQENISYSISNHTLLKEYYEQSLIKDANDDYREPRAEDINQPARQRIGIPSLRPRPVRNDIFATTANGGWDWLETAVEREAPLEYEERQELP